MVCMYNRVRNLSCEGENEEGLYYEAANEEEEKEEAAHISEIFIIFPAALPSPVT